MKFIIDKKNLSTSLPLISTIASSKNIMPVLTNFLIEAESEKGIVKFTATDMHLTAILEVNAEVTVSGKVAVSAKNVADIIQNFDDAPILFEKIEDMLDIVSKKAKFDLYCADHTQFPLMPEFKTEDAYELDARLVKKMINNTHFATSNDTTKPILKGINWKIHPDRQIMVSMDGRRVAENVAKQTVDLPDTLDYTYPARVMSFLEKIIEDSDDPLWILPLETRTLLGYRNVKIVARFLDGRYPNYARILEDTNTNTLIIDKNSLKNAIRRVSLLTTEDSLSIILEVRNDIIFVYSANVEVGEAKESIENFKYDGEPVKVLFNYRYLIQVMSVIETDDIQMTFAPAEEGYSNAQSFLYNHPKFKDLEATYLLMPLRFR